ncbi:MAG: hypothetical protein QOG28_2638, partial [Trebonia sp.]|nr:hypothetical protein [Trebonia sp.]
RARAHLIRGRASASGFARVVQAAGNMVVYEAEAPYRLAAWGFRPGEVSSERRACSRAGGCAPPTRR